MRSVIIIFSLLLLSFLVKSQGQEISGTITGFNKFPLKNVTVKAKKSKNETTTDDRGAFKIAVKKNDNLVIKANGFESYSYRVKSTDMSIKINLIYQDRQKNKEIALDAGYIEREDLEYGLENLATENNVFSNFTDVYDAIKYALPATTIIIENGVKKVQIRGAKL